MSLTKEEKNATFQKYGINENDTGSHVVQVALLTNKIRKLTEHLKVNKKDHHSRRGLLIMVGKRRKYLKYIKSKSLNQYKDLIKSLELRK